jgi:hypothetical protein
VSTTGKIVRYGRQAFLKISAVMLTVFIRNPRAMRALHAGRRGCSRNIVMRARYFRVPSRRT